MIHQQGIPIEISLDISYTETLATISHSKHVRNFSKTSHKIADLTEYLTFDIHLNRIIKILSKVDIT